MEAAPPWGIWFLASFAIFTFYLERPQFVDLRWSVTYWLLVLVTPYGRYKYRDPDVVISLASIVLLMAARMLTLQ